MPTINPRVNVTLRPEVYDLVSRLAKLQQRSRAAVLSELLHEVLPVLERVVVVGEAAKRAEVQAKEGLRESMEKAEAAILPHISAAMNQFDLLIDDATSHLQGHGSSPTKSARERSDRAIRGAPGTPKSPRPVTRGPGRGAKPTKRRRATRKSVLRRGART